MYLSVKNNSIELQKARAARKPTSFKRGLGRLGWAIHPS